MDGVKFKRFRRFRRRLANDHIQPAYDALNATIDGAAKEYMTREGASSTGSPETMTKTQQKLEEARQHAVLELARAAVVDEAGALEAELAPAKMKLKRLDDLRKAIRDWYAGADPSKVFSVYGEEYMATVGAAGNQTVIHDLASIFEAAGRERFLAACTISVSSLKELVDPALASAVTGQRQSGPRAIAIMPIRPNK